MRPYTSINALLLAIPELKTLAPSAYDQVISKAKEEHKGADLKFWYELLQGVIVMTIIPFSHFFPHAGSFIADMLAFMMFYCIMSFAIDFFFFRFLRKTVIAQLFCKVKSN